MNAPSKLTVMQRQRCRRCTLAAACLSGAYYSELYYCPDCKRSYVKVLITKKRDVTLGIFGSGVDTYSSPIGYIFVTPEENPCVFRLQVKEAFDRGARGSHSTCHHCTDNRTLHDLRRAARSHGQDNKRGGG